MTAGLGLLAACGSHQPGTVAKDGSVTVEHIFGETKVPGPPQRVVSAGYTEQDDLLALGVIPVAVTDWFGDEPFAVWPWARAKLGSAKPAVLSIADGIKVDQIAAQKPDLIVATNAGLDKDTYDKLSQIAPTIAQPTADAFFGPWKDQATAISQAVFKANEMKPLIAGVDEKFAAAAKNNPQFAGRTALLLRGSLYRDSVQVMPPGPRTDFLTQLGLAVPNTGDRLIPRDRWAAELDNVDALIWTTESDDEQAALLADPTIQQLNATARKRNVFTGKDLSGAIAFGSPLSYPMVADQLPPLLARVLA